MAVKQRSTRRSPADAVALIHPEPTYQASYLEALAEFHAAGSHRDLDPAALAADFEGFVRRLRERADPASVLPGNVPDTTLWLVRGDRYLGRVSIRHALNKRLRQIGGHVGFEIRPSERRQEYGTLALALALVHAHAIGLERVLVTCDAGNIGSRRIIERNGGVLADTIAVADWPEPVMRFWIATPAHVDSADP
jgi:predicted acetyltransferase